MPTSNKIYIKLTKCLTTFTRVSVLWLLLFCAAYLRYVSAHFEMIQVESDAILLQRAARTNNSKLNRSVALAMLSRKLPVEPMIYNPLSYYPGTESEP
jgi:hypothetical protein